MATKLPPHEMTIQEKLAPWKLSGRTCRDLQMRLNPRNGTARFLMSDDSESPMGQPQFEDWEAAKAKIREKLRWRSRSSMKPKRT